MAAASVSIARWLAWVEAWGRPPRELHQFVAAQLAGFDDGFSLHQFGEQRGASHGGNAALSQKSDFFDAAVGDSQGQLQDIAAGRVLDLGGGVGVGDLRRDCAGAGSDRGPGVSTSQKIVAWTRLRSCRRSPLRSDQSAASASSATSDGRDGRRNCPTQTGLRTSSRLPVHSPDRAVKC